MKKFLAVLLLLTSCLAVLGGCGEAEGPANEPTASVTEMPDLSALDMTEYVTLPQDYRHAEASTGEEIYAAAVAGSTVLKYPEDLVEFFADSMAATNAYYAKLQGVSVGEYLASIGQSEAEQPALAREQAKSELVFRALLQAEDVAISEEEFTAHYQKYAEYYVNAYGYSAEYVQNDLHDEIVGSMLYDKLMEKLSTYVDRGGTK